MFCLLKELLGLVSPVMHQTFGRPVAVDLLDRFAADFSSASIHAGSSYPVARAYKVSGATSISLSHVRIPSSSFTEKWRKKSISLKRSKTPPLSRYFTKSTTP